MRRCACARLHLWIHFRTTFFVWEIALPAWGRMMQSVGRDIGEWRPARRRMIMCIYWKQGLNRITPIHRYLSKILNPLHKVDSLLAGVMDEKDIIIFRFGDNVDDEEAFSLGLQRMIDYCRQYTSNIIITGCFWKRIHTESVLISAARTNHLKYVPLFWIGETYGDSTYCTGDEVFYDVDGNPYKGEHPAFKLHPNDKGMQMIAETIFDSIF